MHSQLWILLLLFTVAAGGLLGSVTEIPVKVALAENPVPVKYAIDGFNDWLDKENAASDMKQEQFTLVGVKEQVVQGKRITLTFQSQTYTCTVSVWDRPWLKDGSALELQPPKCSPQSA